MLLNKSIGSVVEENYVYARALHYLGIEFFESEHLQLDEVCRQKGISRQRVIKTFYEFDSGSKFSFKELESYPMDLLLAYLRHAHQLFIKDKLPYIAHLVRRYQHAEFWDLQEIFPVFVEDFIKHIYEEEDEVFKYIRTLLFIEKGTVKNPIRDLMTFHDMSLKTIRDEHSNEDEMNSLRDFIENIETTDLHGKVIVNELKAFDREILYHAAIENEIMFPKAILLDELVTERLKRISQLN